MSQEYELPQNIETYLSLLAQRLKETNNEELIKIILSKYKIIEEAYCDNDWNNTTHHEIKFWVEQGLFLQLLDRKRSICDELTREINQLHNSNDECFYVKIEAANNDAPDWRTNFEALLPVRKDIIILDSELHRIWGDSYLYAPKVFISHRDTQKPYAKKIKDALAPLGVCCFVAHMDIEVSDEWLKTIDKAMRTSDLFLPLLTEDFFESIWTNQEIGFAYGFGIPIISIKSPKDPTGFISPRQGLRWKRNESFPTMNFFKVLFEAPYVPGKLKEKIKDSMIKTLEKSGDFSTCNLIAMTLEYWDNISDLQLGAIVNAYNNNRCAQYSKELSGEDCYGRKYSNVKKLLYWLNQWRPNMFEMAGRRIVKKVL